MNQVKQALQLLEEVYSDTAIPKNIKLKISEIVQALSTEEEISLKISKALSVLEKLSDDASVEPYTRSQLFNVASMLEIV